MFKMAKAIWLKDKSCEMNIFGEFHFEFHGDNINNYIIMLTASSLYECYVNNEFIGYGPARAAHNYLRVDKLDISKYVKKGINRVRFLVAGYYCSSYYTIKAPSFLQAELLENECVIRHTDINTVAYQNTKFIQKTVRYSYQRTFTQIYKSDNELIKSDVEELAMNCKYLERYVPYPKYNIVDSFEKIESGLVEYIKNEDYPKLRQIYNVGAKFDGFLCDELSENTYMAYQQMSFLPSDILEYTQNTYLMYRGIINNNGFILTDIDVIEDAEILIVFDEKIIDNRIKIETSECVNIVKYYLHKGHHKLKTFESYGFKYIQIVVLKGRVNLNKFELMEYSYPNYEMGKIETKDEDLKLIFNAAKETFRQNTLDVFMDCPTRERAGWLCDSYFTAQSEMFFSGECRVEKVMLENIVLAKNIPNIPNEMLPMCYPADHIDENYIPQWALWFIIELKYYLKRDKKADKGFFKNRCYHLLSFLANYENSDGLLEKLPQWNFIEWSKANDWTNDVNYPTNMLYCKALEICAELYNDQDLNKKSIKIKDIIIKQAFNGKTFCDHGIRKDGILEVSGEDVSEVCQYYALFFDIANINDKKYSYLKNLILNVFGPDRQKENIMPQIAYANSFIGNYLRMEILLDLGLYDKILSEIKAYFLDMAKITGTLWEHNSITGSLNHGFASYIGVVINKCLDNLKGDELK